MPILEYDYSDKDYQLVAEQKAGEIQNYDYLRLIVYTEDNDIVRITNESGEVSQAIFYSSVSEIPFEINISPFSQKLNQLITKTIGGDSNDFKIYRASSTTPQGNGIYIKPNEIFNEFGLPEANYKLQIDFLNQLKPTALLPEYLTTLPFPQYQNEFNLVEMDVESAINYWNNVGRPDIVDYIEENQESIPPFPGDGAVNPPVFFVNPAYDNESPAHYQFIIKQISTSRKEVRLKLINQDIVNNSNIIQDIINTLNSREQGVPRDSYQFKHLLNISTGVNIPITNYQFDEVTDGKDNQSIILRLYSPLPRTVANLSQATIEREVLITQTTDVLYFSEIPPSTDGSGLIPDASENWINPNQNESLELENFNDLTGSIETSTIQNLLSGSDYNYPNLNTDFRLFENHTFFGSAKRKLENFKNKVETIQGYYSNVSSSLSASGVSIDGDSNELIQYRKDLFDKIDSEISTFTPYERFLYFDGQYESTASAPGLGRNYADTKAVSTEYDSYQGQLDKVDGFNTVYHHSSKNLKDNTSINLFINKYRVENKPFFNYKDSVYLSFLMKADDGVSLTWENSYKSAASDTEYVNYYLPQSSMYQNTILSPTITGSQYQRFIFQASQSHWVPTVHAGHDLANIECWGSDSTEIEILSSSMLIKTGSNEIKDSSGKYQNLTNVVTQSGVPFLGSVLPTGELFRVYNTTELSSSLVGYYRFDEDDGNDCLDSSGNDKTGSLKNTGANKGIRISGSSDDSNSRQASGSAAGKSIFFGEGSGARVEIDEDMIPNLTTTDFSITAFINPTSASHEFDTIVARRDSFNTGFQLDIRDTSDNNDGIHPFGLGFAIQQSGSGAIATDSPSTIPTGSYSHVAVVVDRSDKATLFVNGVQVNQSSDITSVGEKITGSNPPIGIGSKIKEDKTASNGFGGYIDEVRFYDRALTHTEVKQLSDNPDGVIDTKITDVKVSLNNPTNVLPFDNIYHTSSAEWTSWYNGTYDSASIFDRDNIHSLENNLPTYIQDSSEYDDLKDFLALQGEQYDIVRNHIDGLSTIHDRGYTEYDSPPKNILPMLLNSIGWNAVNPFSGSLSDSLGSYLSGVTSIDDIKNNTWRKTLNNLLYVYKTKGTQNSVRAMMNIYGYPPDVLKVKEFGGSTQNVVDGGIISDTEPSSEETQIDTDLQNQTGSISFIRKKEKLYNYRFQGKSKRSFNLDWWMNDADTETIEFVLKHYRTTQPQILFESSGSNGEKLWDLRLVPATDGISSSFEFRLNNSNTGSDAIADNAVSMSTAFSNMTDGQLWNVKLQRMTSSVSGSGTNEYRLHTTLQNDTSVQTYNYVTMSISGGLTNTYVTGGADSNYYANQNWISSGSRHYLSSSNLYVGTTFSGSMAQIKAWTTPLSMSRFRQHTLNKFSTLGNTIASHCNELLYHFKLNENYSTSSISSSNQTSVMIIDSSPKDNLTTDYSFEFTRLDIITGSCASALYGFDIVDTVKIGFKDNNQDGNNDNTIIINPPQQIVGNLDSQTSIYGNAGQSSYNTSRKLELNNSPQDIINIHILNHTDSFNLEKYYGNPQYYYSSSYKELDDLRKEFFVCSPILIDTNQYIRSQENIFNESIGEAVNQTVPASSTLSDANSTFGVTIKPTVLERQKYEQEEYSVETNPNSPSGSLSFVSTGSYQHNFVLSSLLELPHSSSISLGSAYVSESVDGRFLTPQFLQPGGYTASLESEKTGSISPLPKFTGSLESPLSSSISMGNLFVSESDDKRSVVPPFIQQGGVTSSIEFPKSASIEEITTQFTKEFVNIHDSWGTGDNDTHFINYATKEPNVYNVSNLDLVFKQSASAGSTITLSSIEVPDGNSGITGSTNPDLSRFVYKTITYTAVSSSGTANLDFNGAFNADSSSVLFLTGSGTTLGAGSQSQAENLLAAITSSNGHGDSFDFTQQVKIFTVLKNRVPLISKIKGLAANTISASIGHQSGSGPGGLEDAISTEPINNAIAFSGGSIGVPDFNDGHIDTRYNFRMIGDTEYYSASFNNSDNFSNVSYFYNREQITENLGLGEIKYESFINPSTITYPTSFGDLGLQDGRMLGKTRYFYTASNPLVLSASVLIPSGHTIILPANHISKFSTPFKDRMYEGSKNTSPGFLNTPHEDYSTASFYRVNVTGGENQIYVKGSGNPTIDTGDNITY